MFIEDKTFLPCTELHMLAIINNFYRCGLTLNVLSKHCPESMQLIKCIIFESMLEGIANKTRIHNNKTL